MGNPSGFDDEDLPVALLDPSKAGYEFVAWHDADSLDSVVTEISLGTDENVTLWAEWTEVFNITYTLDGAVNHEDNPDTFIEDDLDITLGVPTKVGYTFVAWYEDVEGGPDVIITNIDTARDYSVYPTWTINNTTITFNSNGGSAVDPINEDFGTAIDAPDDPTLADHVFDGWYEDDGVWAVPYTVPATQPAANITVYAKWIEEFTVTYESNDGTAVDPETVLDGELATEPDDPTKEHYTFVAWHDTIGLEGAFDFTTPIDADTTLYAEWAAVDYGITYNLDDGENHQDNPETFNAEDSLPIALGTPTKADYTFTGWYLDVEGGSDILITEIADTLLGSDIVIYATWELT